MADRIEKQVPKIDPAADFASIWSQLTGTQIEMLKYINGITPVSAIFKTLRVTRDQATAELLWLVKAGCVLLSGAEEFEASSRAEAAETPAVEKPGVDPLAMFDAIPDDVLGPGGPAPPLEAIPGDDLAPPAEAAADLNLEDLDPFAGNEGREDEVHIAGLAVPALLLDTARDQASCSYRFTHAQSSTTVDFYKGELTYVSVEPRDLRTCLGVLLVKHAKMDKKFLAESLKMRKFDGTYQAEALIKLGALPPKEILNMLRAQTERRLGAMIGEPRLTCRKVPSRTEKMPETRLPWRKALFNACYRSLSVDQLRQWAIENSKRVLTRDASADPKKLGVGQGVLVFWSQYITSGVSVSRFSTLGEVQPEPALRTLYAFYVLGLVKIVDFDNQEPDQAEPLAEWGSTEVAPPVVEKTPKPVEQTPPPEETPAPIDQEKLKAKKEKQKRKKLKDDKAAQIREEMQVREKRAIREFRKGAEHLKIGAWTVAHEHFLRALGADPENPLLKAAHVFCEYAQERLPERARDAVAMLKQAMQTHPDEPEVSFMLGMAFKFEGQPDKAYALFSRALEKSPNHVAALREVRLYNQNRSSKEKSGLKNLFNIGKK
jgi:tetratricopeptide (TPR) repeat protein